MAELTQIEGVGPAYAEQLKAVGVGTTEALLATGGNPDGRKDLAGRTGIPETLILQWVNHVDLFRISGVSEEYADCSRQLGWTRSWSLLNATPGTCTGRSSR